MPDPLYRVFPWDPSAAPDEPGGALFVPREAQGFGRHDNPERYGAMYLSREPVAAAAEVLRMLRVRSVRDQDLRIEGGTIAFAVVEPVAGALIDLDDPSVLETRRLRPSRVATRERRTTREIAATLFDEGHAGFAWWSTIEASWINVTLFAERADVRVVGGPEAMTLAHPAVAEAAEVLGLDLAA